MKDWQKLMLRAAGAAAGVTAALAAVAILLFWYGSRPKSWDAKAITCVSANASAVYHYIPATRAMKVSGFSLRFALANNTGRDYTIPVNVRLFKRQASNQALEVFGGNVDHPFLIPAHDRAQFTIQADYGCGVSDLDTGRETERDEPTCYHDAFGDVNGFVALDEENKIRFDLPKPTLVTGNDLKASSGKTPDKPVQSGEKLQRPDSGDVFDRIVACQAADELVALCRKHGVRPPPDSFAAHGGYADHLSEWPNVPRGYRLDATPEACELAMEWQNFCRDHNK